MACPHVSVSPPLSSRTSGRRGFTNVECQQRLLGALKAQNIDVLTGFPGRKGRGYTDASAVSLKIRARLRQGLRSMSTKSPSSRPTSLGLLSATETMVRLSNQRLPPKRRSPIANAKGCPSMPRSMLRAAFWLEDVPPAECSDGEHYPSYRYRSCRPPGTQVGPDDGAVQDEEE